MEGSKGYIANIYIRHKDAKGNCLSVQESMAEESTAEELIPKITELENYTETLNTILDKFKKNEITRQWNGYNSFKYNFKGDFSYFKECIEKYITLKNTYPDMSCLNVQNMDKEYKLDVNLPIQIVENVLDSDVLNIFKDYYKTTIAQDIWPLGDRQSNRYKAHNEPMSRFLHYEILPLIEKITGKHLKPTYTYLSAYVKGADLPGHTDREDCEYTVSFVVDKPDDSKWNIYIHKEIQPVKHKDDIQKILQKKNVFLWIVKQAD